MASAVAIAAPGCCLRFGSLDFIANQDGEFGLRAKTPTLQAIRFGSLDFITDGVGGLRRQTDEEEAASRNAALSPSPALFPCAPCIAMVSTCPEDGAFTSCSEDEAEQPERLCCMAQVEAEGIPQPNADAAANHA
jgi:hypothetical protein